MKQSHQPWEDKYLKERIVTLGTPIDDDVATEFIAKLLFLEKQSISEPVTIYINSPGGSATAGIAIIRTIESLEPRVHTHGIGQAHSLAAIILAAGSCGFRSAAADSLIAFSRVRPGSAMTPKVQAHLLRIEEELLEITCRHTGMTKAYATLLFESSDYLSPQQACDLGIIDRIF